MVCKDSICIKNIDHGYNTFYKYFLSSFFGLPWWLRCKESTYKTRDPGSIPGSGRSLGEENGFPPQYSCLENPLDRGAWQAAVHRVAKSRTGLKKVNYHSNPKQRQCQRMFKLPHSCTYLMRNTGLDEAQAGIKIARRNINNLRYADDTTFME